jgi:hypothetical protein
VSYSVLDYSRKPVPVYVGKNKFESLTVAAEFLSGKIRGKVYAHNLRKAIEENYPIGGLKIRLDLPAKKPGAKKPQGSQAGRKQAKALADLGELGADEERPAASKVPPEHTRGMPLLRYPPGEGPLARGRRVWR